MKRIFLGIALCAGMLFMGATSASAAVYCSDDPTLGIGLPINYNLNLSLSAAGISTTVYGSGTRSTTTFGFTAGIR
jgi:hypothetical protein